MFEVINLKLIEVHLKIWCANFLPSFYCPIQWARIRIKNCIYLLSSGSFKYTHMHPTYSEYNNPSVLFQLKTDNIWICLNIYMTFCIGNERGMVIKIHQYSREKKRNINYAPKSHVNEPQSFLGTNLLKSNVIMIATQCTHCVCNMNYDFIRNDNNTHDRSSWTTIAKTHRSTNKIYCNAFCLAIRKIDKWLPLINVNMWNADWLASNRM